MEQDLSVEWEDVCGWRACIWERQWGKWEIVMYLMLKVGDCLSIKSELDGAYWEQERISFAREARRKKLSQGVAL